MIFPYSKRPGETETISIDLNKRMPTGATITTATTTVSTLKGTTDCTLTGAVVSGKQISCQISGGEIDGVYDVLFRVNLSDNQVKENVIRVTIVNEEEI